MASKGEVKESDDQTLYDVYKPTPTPLSSPVGSPLKKGHHQTDEFELELDTVFELGDTEVTETSDAKETGLDLTEFGFNEEMLEELMSGRINPASFPGIPKETLLAFQRDLMDAFAALDMGSDRRTAKERKTLPVKTGDPTKLLAMYDQGRPVADRKTKQEGMIITCIGSLCKTEVFVPATAVTNKLDVEKFLCSVCASVCGSE